MKQALPDFLCLEISAANAAIFRPNCGFSVTNVWRLDCFLVGVAWRTLSCLWLYNLTQSCVDILYVNQPIIMDFFLYPLNIFIQQTVFSCSVQSVTSHDWIFKIATGKATATPMKNVANASSVATCNALLPMTAGDSLSLTSSLAVCCH